jgi:hypothetical protein
LNLSRNINVFRYHLPVHLRTVPTAGKIKKKKVTPLGIGTESSRALEMGKTMAKLE